MFETLWMTRRLASMSVWRDMMLAPARRLREIAPEAPGGDARRALVFCPEPSVCDLLPSAAPQPVLWAWHTPSFPGVTPEENKRRLYLQLYYSGVDAAEFARLVRTAPAYRISLFGWGRGIAGLAADRKPISDEEERAEADGYARFVAGFDRASAAGRQISYAVVEITREIPFANIDRWYERDAGERVGHFTLYRLRLRP
jgi:hypothetical protein